MDRRHVLSGFIVVAATSALAQTRPQPIPPGAGNAIAPAGQADLQHLQQTIMLGTMALETSRIAFEKAQNQDLKRFAKFETDEQTTLGEVIKAMIDPAATTATAATASSPMDPKAREMVQKLSQASGTAFDREYLSGQMQGHQELLRIQESYLASNPQNREHVGVAKLARGMIREHIALLEDIQTKLR